MKQVIKSEFLQKIKEDEALILDIAQHQGKKFRTAYQWVLDAQLKNDHEPLLIPAVFRMIKDRFKIMDNSEILESVESKVA